MQLEHLNTLTRAALKDQWTTLVGSPPPRKLSQLFMRKVIAFELQARAYGDLSGASQKRLIRLQRDKKPTLQRQMQPGARFIREWNGISHIVDVTKDGYLWQGRVYRSLSAIARTITGTRWSGPRFFGL